MNGRHTEDRRVARCGVGPGHVKPGCQYTTISDKLAESTKAQEGHQCLLDSFVLVRTEAQVERATDVVATGKLTLFGRTIVRLVETHMSDRTLCRKVCEETECFTCFKEGGGNLSDLPRAILARHELALKVKRIV